MKRLLGLPLLVAMLVLCCSHLYAQAPKPKPKVAPPEVDVAEVVRRGAMVTQSGVGIRAGDAAAVISATAPPVDDANRWFVTVWTSANCAPCEKLKADFASSPDLLAFVDAPEHTTPWAHFNVYREDDATQAWRKARYRLDGYPTIVVQPPLDQSWGDPGTVIVSVKGYQGDPKKLAKQISDAVKTYAKVMGAKGYPKPPKVAEEAKRGAGVIGGNFFKPGQSGVSADTKVEQRGARQAGQQVAGDSRVAPFSVPQPVPQFQPQTYPQQPQPGSNFGPEPSQQVPTSSWPTSLLGGPQTTNLLLLALTVWSVYREVRLRQGKTLIFNDAAAAGLTALLTTLFGGPRPSPAPTPQPVASATVFPPFVLMPNPAVAATSNQAVPGSSP